MIKYIISIYLIKICLQTNMGNTIDKEEKLELNVKEVDVYVKGKLGKCSFVLSYDDMLEPHFRRISHSNKSEILAIIKCLEHLDKTEFNKINIFSESRETIDYIKQHIYIDRSIRDKNLKSLMYLTSNKIVNFYYKELKENNFVKTMLNYKLK